MLKNLSIKNCLFVSLLHLFVLSTHIQWAFYFFFFKNRPCKVKNPSLVLFYEMIHFLNIPVCSMDQKNHGCSHPFPFVSKGKNKKKIKKKWRRSDQRGPFIKGMDEIISWLSSQSLRILSLLGLHRPVHPPLTSLESVEYTESPKSLSLVLSMVSK